MLKSESTSKLAIDNSIFHMCSVLNGSKSVSLLRGDFAVNAFWNKGSTAYVSLWRKSKGGPLWRMWLHIPLNLIFANQRYFTN